MGTGEDMLEHLNLKFNRAVSYQWPGTGKDCGRIGYKWRACPHLKHYQRYKNSCHRRDCPEHWRDWLREESAAAADRVKEAGRQRWQHVVVSLGDKHELPKTTDGRVKELEKIRWILRFVGFRGGATVAHSARAHTVEQAHVADSGGHYHILASGWCDGERVLSLYESAGIVVIAFGRDNKRPFKRFEYMLSHAALPVVINPARSEGTTSLHAITYWGILAYNKLKVPDFEPEIWCSGCQQAWPARHWHELTVMGDPPDKNWGPLDDAVGRIFQPVGWQGEQI